MAKVNIKSEKTTPFRLFYYSYVCRHENIILFIYNITIYIILKVVSYLSSVTN